MPEKWTGRLVGRMHNSGVTRDDLAAEMGIKKAYLSLILNSKRKPPNIKQRAEAAFEAVLEKQKEGDVSEQQPEADNS